MLDACSELHEQWDVVLMAFGDLFLENVRAHRAIFLQETGFVPVSYTHLTLPTNREV